MNGNMIDSIEAMTSLEASRTTGIVSRRRALLFAQLSVLTHRMSRNSNQLGSGYSPVDELVSFLEENTSWSSCYLYPAIGRSVDHSLTTFLPGPLNMTELLRRFHVEGTFAKII